MIAELQVSSYGPLAPLIEDPLVTEILTVGPLEVWYEKFGLLHRHTEMFSSPLAYHNFLQRICSEARLRPDLEVPHADGEWRGYRVHIAQPPIAANGVCLSLRRRSPHHWRLEDLIERKWADRAAVEVLQRKMLEHKSLLVVGPTGAGKTAVLNACLKEVPENERVVSIEDTDEIHLPNAASVKLLTREPLTNDLRTYTQADLVKQALRMRPDRLVVGEVRGPEAKDLLLALSTGHGGSLATLHASSARQALLRLEMLVQMGAPQWRLETVRNLIYLGLDSIVVVKKENGERRLDGVFQITSLEETGFCLERITG